MYILSKGRDLEYIFNAISTYMLFYSEKLWGFRAPCNNSTQGFPAFSIVKKFAVQVPKSFCNSAKECQITCSDM